MNPQVAGNWGGVFAEGRDLHGFVASAPIVIPANGVVVFTRDSQSAAGAGYARFAHVRTRTTARSAGCIKYTIHTVRM